MDLIYFNCKRCGNQFKIPKAAAGRTGKCIRCGEPCVVPNESNSDEPPASPAIDRSQTPTVAATFTADRSLVAMRPPGPPPLPSALAFDAATQADDDVPLPSDRRYPRVNVFLLVVGVIALIAAPGIWTDSKGVNWFHLPGDPKAVNAAADRLWKIGIACIGLAFLEPQIRKENAEARAKLFAKFLVAVRSAGRFFGKRRK